MAADAVVLPAATRARATMTAAEFAKRFIVVSEGLYEPALSNRYD
jgi:hypothetical protein